MNAYLYINEHVIMAEIMADCLYEMWWKHIIVVADYSKH